MRKLILNDDLPRVIEIPDDMVFYFYGNTKITVLRKFNDGDIITNGTAVGIFKNYASCNSINCYILFKTDRFIDNQLVSVEGFEKASDEKVKKFKELLSRYGYMWNETTKELYSKYC